MRLTQQAERNAKLFVVNVLNELSNCRESRVRSCQLRVASRGSMDFLFSFSSLTRCFLHSDELMMKLFLKSRLSLEKNQSQVRINFAYYTRISILAYYTTANDETNCVGLSMFVVVVQHRSGGFESVFRQVLQQNSYLFLYYIVTLRLNG